MKEIKQHFEHVRALNKSERKKANAKLKELQKELKALEKALNKTSKSLKRASGAEEEAFQVQGQSQEDRLEWVAYLVDAYEKALNRELSKRELDEAVEQASSEVPETVDAKSLIAEHKAQLKAEKQRVQAVQQARRKAAEKEASMAAQLFAAGKKVKDAYDAANDIHDMAQEGMNLAESLFG
eukprot:TRINITY_DN13183_c0_g1_i1.p1 TRINITY_DN13183_c0_g1~~TRINITY_DN13183_c0_g1_i1.p1  ORF type:complete len:182 (+),score=62.06 TRINITY_DN13183_c0_g1_i1:391-936(+)